MPQLRLINTPTVTPNIDIVADNDGDLALRVTFDGDTHIDLGYFDNTGSLFLFDQTPAERKKLSPYFALNEAGVLATNSL